MSNPHITLCRNSANSGWALFERFGDGPLSQLNRGNPSFAKLVDDALRRIDELAAARPNFTCTWRSADAVQSAPLPSTPIGIEQLLPERWITIYLPVGFTHAPERWAILYRNERGALFESGRQLRFNQQVLVDQLRELFDQYLLAHFEPPRGAKGTAKPEQEVWVRPTWLGREILPANFPLPSSPVLPNAEANREACRRVDELRQRKEKTRRQMAAADKFREDQEARDRAIRGQ